MYAYVRTAAEAAPAVVTSYEVAANRIAGECPGVLAGSPSENEIEVGSAVRSTTARQRGEANRRQAQLRDLEAELSSELEFAERAPRAPAVTAFLASLKNLPHGGLALSQLVRADTTSLEEGLRAESVDVCADMKAWAASGYRALSPASRAIALKSEADLARFFAALIGQAAEQGLSATETVADEELVRKTTKLELRVARGIQGSLESARAHVESALGLTTRQDRREELKSKPPESHVSTQIAAGRTAAGSGYTIWLERKKSGSVHECKLSVEVRGASGAPPGISEIIQAESDICLKPREDRSREPSIKCSQGLLTIRTEVEPATRTVDLRMSDGTQIVSRPTLVSRRLGGPDAFYYQAVRGPSPIPVSLIERDARGNVLQTVKLSRTIGCSKHPVKYLQGGKQTLVSGQAPQGPHFAIVGERYRLFGRLHLQLKLTTGEGLVSTSEDEEGVESPNESFAVPVKRATPLDSESSAGCRPHEYSIFYGLLKQSRDVVLAKVSGAFVPLSRVRLPASLHMRGVLVYLASTGQPEEIVVRSPSGKLLMSENRVSRATEGRETCEGESEGSGPTPSFLGGAGETSRIVIDARPGSSSPMREAATPPRVPSGIPAA